MATDYFLDDILPRVTKHAKDLIDGDTKDALMGIDNGLDVRADLANDLRQAGNTLRAASAQHTYDAASVLQRQVTVISMSREEYHAASLEERNRLGRFYSDIRAQGSSLKNVNTDGIDGVDDGRPVDEPYLGVDGQIVFEEG